MDVIIINDKEFKQIRVNKNYWISSDGELYSKHANKIINASINSNLGKLYKRVDIRVDGKPHHMMIHRLVYDTWVSPITRNDQINHINDDSLDNRVENLYKGSQKSNIADCVRNGHRVGHIKYLTVFDKKIKKPLTFCPSSDFIEYSKHPCQNGSIKRMFNKNWFKKRYIVIDFKSVNDKGHLKSVTTMADECKPVSQILSLVEAHS
jgi:hypothetical protein